MSKRPKVQLNLSNKDVDQAKQIARRNPDKDGIVTMKEYRLNRIEEEAVLMKKYLEEHGKKES